MSYKRRSDYKPPRARSEVRVAVLTSLAITLATASFVWFLRPNRESKPSIPAPSTPTVITTAPSLTTAPSSAPAPAPASSTP
jgi:hypothetical protein